MENPSFSIVIASYRRPGPLAACLQSLAQLDYPRDRFEAVVVDDGSQPSLAPVVEAARGPLEVRFLRQKNAGPATARNTGAAQARGRFLAFTDDDCAPSPDWLTTGGR